MYMSSILDSLAVTARVDAGRNMADLNSTLHCTTTSQSHNGFPPFRGATARKGEGHIADLAHFQVLSILPQFPSSSSFVGSSIRWDSTSSQSPPLPHSLTHSHPWQGRSDSVHRSMVRATAAAPSRHRLTAPLPVRSLVFFIIQGRGRFKAVNRSQVKRQAQAQAQAGNLGARVTRQARHGRTD